MNNIRMLIRNLADVAALTANPALLSTLPETNLQRNTERGRSARTSSLASQDFHLTWTSDQKANMVAFTRTNWTTAATFHPTVYGSGSPTPIIYDSGILSAFSTTGLDTDIDIYTEADFAAYRASVHYFPAGFTNISTMRELNFTNLDAANPDGYMDQTRLWVGKYFEFFYDPPFGGVQLEPMDASLAERADDGSHIVDKRWKARKLTIRLEFVADADLKTLLAAFRYLGKDREFFISLFPNAGGALELYGQMACRVTATSPVDLLASEAVTHRGTLTLEET